MLPLILALVMFNLIGMVLYKFSFYFRWSSFISDYHLNYFV